MFFYHSTAASLEDRKSLKLSFGQGNLIIKDGIPISESVILKYVAL